jgi:hypothetical protein
MSSDRGQTDGHGTCDTQVKHVPLQPTLRLNPASHHGNSDSFLSNAGRWRHFHPIVTWSWLHALFMHTWVHNVGVATLMLVMILSLAGLVPFANWYAAIGYLLIVVILMLYPLAYLDRDIMWQLCRHSFQHAYQMANLVVYLVVHGLQQASPNHHAVTRPEMPYVLFATQKWGTHVCWCYMVGCLLCLDAYRSAETENADSSCAPSCWRCSIC